MIIFNYNNILPNFPSLLDCPIQDKPILIPHHNAINPCIFETIILLNSIILFGPGLYQLCQLLIGRYIYNKRGIRLEEEEEEELIYDSLEFKKLSKLNIYRSSIVLLLGLIFLLRSDLFYFQINGIALILIGVPLSIVESFTKMVSSGSLLFYFLFQSIILFLALVQSTMNKEFSIANGSPILDYSFVGCLFLLFLSSSFYQPTFTVISRYLKTNEHIHANILSQITFSWMNELIDKGYRNCQITEEDIPTPPGTILDTQLNYLRLEKEYKGKKFSLLFALIKVFGLTVIIAVLYELVDDLLSFLQPQILKYLLKFFTSEISMDEQPLIGYLLAAGLFLNSVISTALYNKFFILIYEASLGTKSSLMTLIYHKALRLSPKARKDHPIGDIINLLSVDTSRIQDLASQFQSLVSAPIKLVLCIISLYSLLGKATFAGLVVMMVMIPINTIISKKMKLTFKTQMKFKDQRTRVTNEILTNIKSIKLYAIEKAMFDRLSHVRNDLELSNLGKIGCFSAIMNFMWSSVPFMVTCLTFATFALINDEKLLTPEIVFPALALFDLLSEPIYAIPSIITSLIETNVSFQRINKFLSADEIDSNLIIKLDPCTKSNEIALSVNNCQFFWETSSAALSINNFQAKKGQLTCIVGKVGSGKSTFLQSILGFLPSAPLSSDSSAKIVHHGSIAYCSQIPWIMNATVRENILFGHKYDSEFYQQTLETCQLLPDLEILPDGDETFVGEKGISLSGGQRARLSLARAVYSRADIYLLDDVLAAVDSHVAKNIVDQVILGCLKSKCIILATNSINYVLKHSCEILLLEQGGEIVQRGNFKDLKKDSKLGQLVEQFGKIDQQDNKQINTSPSSTRRASLDSSFNNKNFLTSKKQKQNKKSENLEKASKGKINFKVYQRYAKSCGTLYVCIFILLMILATTFQLFANYILKNWSEDNSRTGSNTSIAKYIGLYTIFGLGGSLFTLGRTIFMWLICSIRASRIIHDDMALSVLRSPMNFFETTPIGRILNRFTSDINKIDESIPRVFAGFFGSIIRTILILGFIAFNMPFFALIILIVCSLYIGYQRYYVATSRDLKRIVNISKSPIFQHVQESLTGVDTVLAYDQRKRFQFLNFHNLNFNLKALYLFRSINRWLSIRLQFLGSLIIFSAATLSIKNQLGAGLAGLIITYALRVTSSLNWIVRMTVEVETNLVSIERVLDYTELPSEAKEHTNLQINGKWPQEGAVTLVNYSTRYRENLDLVLQDINLDIKPGEKIGIVGRTGAGKSSLALAIFRIIEPVAGNIVIDKINTSLLGLTDLRSNLAIIPQDSQAFAGTIRSNLDPLQKYTDEELWWALELAHLKEFVEKLGFQEEVVDEGSTIINPQVGLYAQLSEGGSNISVGQRQLLCLAKALLNKSKVLILDEATASVDFQTDKIIQETIRREFQDRTILTIAHRLDTIMDSDRVVVLERGKVEQFDTVENLLKIEDGLFYQLCMKAGIV